MLYWFIFIYYSLQAISELMELYAVNFKRQKGALALVFELNHLLGLGVTVYLQHFTYLRLDDVTGKHHSKSDIVNQDFKLLQGFVYMHAMSFYIMFGIALVLFGCMGWRNVHHKKKAS